MDIDLDALRREAEGKPMERVIVTRRWLAMVLDRIEAKAVLDVEFPPMSHLATDR